MTIRTSDDIKELIDRAMELSPEEVVILKELSTEDAISAVKLAAQLLTVPSVVHKSLRLLSEKSLVISVAPVKKDIIASERDEYFVLSDEGQELKTVLPLVEKTRGVSRLSDGQE